MFVVLKIKLFIIFKLVFILNSITLYTNEGCRKKTNDVHSISFFANLNSSLQLPFFIPYIQHYLKRDYILLLSNKISYVNEAKQIVLNAE
jgi:nicotinamide riboside kinase